jgi:hypothetical protein
VNQINTHLRRCLEGGLTLRYLAQLNHEALFRSRTKSDDDGSSMYFVFTLSHMGPAFSGFGFLIFVQHHSVYRRMLAQAIQ